ncbi:competence type IV pilus assembly protein ComGB [Vagococcus xieshaowenii]|uniref:competence type IV pilus assembly protein ComGB n=1 Tax=Vagococcus xieshaowenii TaxID=2562451 RepID=UPI001432712E|nr:competence type IV pilus assembly protein ComGB [Vagococcus xieshaowenii]
MKLKLKNNHKLSLQQQVNVTQLMSDMLENGFSFQESMSFLCLIYESDAELFKQASEKVMESGSITQGVALIGLKKQYIAQLYLSEHHGDLAGAFFRIANQLTDYQKQRKNLIKVLVYPIMLLVFLIGILFLMKFVLLPSMNVEKENQTLAMALINNFPYVFLVLLLIGLLCYGVIVSHRRNHTAIAHYSLLTRLPIVGKLIKLYLTSYMAHEWGKLLAHGIELTGIISIMENEENTLLMQEMGSAFQKSALKGEAMYDVLAACPIFLPGFSLMVRQGERKGKLSEELLMYSNKLWEELLNKIEKLTNYLQPTIFLFVAVMIIAVYAALLLPIYENIEVFT